MLISTSLHYVTTHYRHPAVNEWIGQRLTSSGYFGNLPMGQFCAHVANLDDALSNVPVRPADWKKGLE